MIQIFALCTQEDQQAFALGRMPEHIISRPIPTECRAVEYRNGIEAMADLTEYNIEDETDTTLRIAFDDEPAQTLTFASVNHKNYYREGLEDADGFVRVQLIERDDEDNFERIQGLYKKASDAAAEAAAKR